MRVVIADDDAVVVESLQIVLDAQPDIEVAGCGTDGADAVRLAADAAPDIVLLDIQMPGMDGLAAAEKILASPTPPRVVFLTTFSDDEYIVRALALGAAGYLIKQDVAGVAPALRAVMAGRSVLEGEVLERAVALGAGAPVAEKPDLTTVFPQLTDREREDIHEIHPAGWGHNREVDIVNPDGSTYHGAIFNRSHLLAKSLGGDDADYNLVTGTRTQNVGDNTGQNGGMAYTEGLARDWLRHNDGTVYYSATPVYEGDELLPRSVIVDVRSSDGELDLEVEVYNAVAGYDVDYATGRFSAAGE